MRAKARPPETAPHRVLRCHALCWIIAYALLQGGEAAAEGLSPLDKRRQGDASVDRSLLLPSAETLPDGAATIDSYQLIGLGVSYGLTDDVTFSASTLLPILPHITLPFLAHLKARLSRWPTALLSVQATAGTNYSLVQAELAGGLSLAVLLDLALDPTSDLTLSLSLHGGWVGRDGTRNANCYDCGDPTDYQDSAGFLSATAAFNARVSKHVKLLTEAIFTTALTADGVSLVKEAISFNYGVRFCGTWAALDLSLIRHLHPGMDLDPVFILGIPYMAFSFRF